MSLQHRRSFVSSCRSCVLTLIFALSLAMVLHSVSLGLLRLLIPTGVQLKACRGSLPLSILNTCPRYFQQRLFINIETSSCFIFSLNVLFDLNSFQCVFVIFLIFHLFSKAFSFSSISLVDFQLSQPYVRTGNIHELNRLSYVLLPSGFDLQTFASCLKALDARAMRVLISDVASPSYDILLPK
jgi:hypothetical protein